jgi:DNA-binding winged helix-turn-helix (wHTH) protein/Tol biopolymer transport system component
MQQVRHNPTVVHFGVFELDRETGELRKQGVRLKLSRQAFQILELLLEKPGTLVSRDELRQKLWPADTFVDFEHSLNATVNRVREVLGDSAENPTFIETLPRRGYRFIQPVHGLLESSQSAAQTRSRKTRTMAALITTVIIVAAALAAHRLFSRTRTLSLENIQMTKLTDGGTAVHVGISPDGHYVAYAMRAGAKQGLWLRQLTAQTEFQILPPDYGDFLGITFSPDSNYIYFVRADRDDLTVRYLYSVPALGGPVRKLISHVDSPVSFSPDGREFVYQRFDPPHNDLQVRTTTADLRSERLLAVIHNGDFLNISAGPGPDWSPDGRTIAIPVRLQSTPVRCVLDIISVADGKIRELFSSSTELDNFGRPVWLPSGDLLILPHWDPSSRRVQLWTVSFPGGQAHRLTNDLFDYDTGDLDITRDGKIIVAIAETGIYNIWAAPRQNVSQANQITHGELPMIWVVQVKNGKLVSVSWDFDLWVMNPDGSERVSFGDIHTADWPESCGNFVLFTRTMGGGPLMRADPDGTRVTQLANSNVISPACSPDGKSAFYVNVEQPQKIWRVPVEGGTPFEIARILGDRIVDRLSVSPDGKFLAYPYSQSTNTQAAGWNLAVIPAGGGPPVATFKLSAEIRNPRWSPDGRGVEYLLTRDAVTNLWEQRLSGGKPKQLTNFTTGHMFDFNWSADRSRLFLTRGSMSSNVILLQRSR